MLIHPKVRRGFPCSLPSVKISGVEGELLILFRWNSFFLRVNSMDWCNIYREPPVICHGINHSFRLRVFHQTHDGEDPFPGKIPTNHHLWWLNPYKFIISYLVNPYQSCLILMFSPHSPSVSNRRFRVYVFGSNQTSHTASVDQKARLANHTFYSSHFNHMGFP